MGIWHYYVPIDQRRRMRELDRHYRKIIDENLLKDKFSTRSSLIRANTSDYIV